MPLRYTTTLVILFMILAISRGFVLQQYRELAPFGVFHASADAGGDGGSGDGGGSAGDGGSGDGGGSAGDGGGGSADGGGSAGDGGSSGTDGGGSAGDAPAGGDTGGPSEILGCMDSTATNYNPAATSQSGVTCSYPVYGCMDSKALNYNPAATSQTGITCTYPPIPRCIVSVFPSTITLGQSTALSWGFSSDVISFSIDNGITIKPGESYRMISPTVSTTYSGVATNPYSSVTCSSSVTVTAPPPAPTCSITATPASVPYGGRSFLEWHSTNATSCAAVGPWTNTGTLNANGWAEGLVNSSYNFALQCTGPGGQVSCSAPVTVAPRPAAPVIGCMDPTATNYNPAATSQTGVTCTYAAPTCSITATPSSVAYGGSSLLVWKSTHATSCVAIGPWTNTGTLNANGVAGGLTSNTTFTFQCTGPGGQVSCSAPVTVAPRPAAPVIGCMDPTATNYNPAATSQTGVTCTYAAPTCSITATPSSVAYGGSSLLVWKSTHATSCVAIGPWTNTGTLNANGVAGNLTSNTTFGFQCTGPGGQVSCSTNVAVAPRPPTPVIGCMDPTATNYNPAATSQTGVTCLYAPTCMLSASPSTIQTGDSSTLSWVTTHTTSFVITSGNTSLGSLTPVVSGSTIVSPLNTAGYTGTATGPGGSVTCGKLVTVTPAPPVVVHGCTNPSATNYNPGATVDNGSCAFPPVVVRGCTDSTATNYNPSATVDNGSCTYPPPPAPGAPTCTLSASPASVSAGAFTVLTWSTTNSNTLTIDNGVGAVAPTVGGTINSLAVNANTTFTGTAVSPSGKTATCTAAVTIAVPPPPPSGGGGGGPVTYLGGGGGGGVSAPSITLSALPHVSAQPLAYLYLSQIPYTGLDLGPVGTVFYWLALIAFALAASYLVLFYGMPRASQSLRNFGARVSTVLNTREDMPAVAMATAAPARSAPPVAPMPPAGSTGALPDVPRGYSSYDGFKSFARNGAISIEDIVKGLSRVPFVASAKEGHHHTALAPAAQPPVNIEPVYDKVEPAYDRVEPIYENVETVEADTTAAPPHIRGFAAALVEGDRAAVFAGLRQHIRGGGIPEKLITDIVCLLDDAYRARIDGATADTDIARLSARLSTPVLEKLIGALTIGIDSSYSEGVTGAKLALTRALSVLGA